MFSKLGYTWSLMGTSWQILKKDKELLLFPLISSICCLLIIATFAVPLFATGFWQPPARDAAFSQQAAYYGVLFLFYLVNYFVVIFFNSAVVACAVIRMQGANPTFGDGLRAAGARLGPIFGWAVVSATVSLILRIIEDRSETAGRIVASLLGMAWSVVSFLAIPVMVVERKGPVEALKRSTSLLKETWGEQLIGNFSFGLIFMLLGIPGFLVIGAGFVLGSKIAMILCITAGVAYFVLLGLVQSVLQAIFRAALYLYALNGEEPADFAGGQLHGAMRSR